MVADGGEVAGGADVVDAAEKGVEELRVGDVLDQGGDNLARLLERKYMEIFIKRPALHVRKLIVDIHLTKKNSMRRPGIEPGSQEWESCMIPLHQRRAMWGGANFIGQ